jgi:hypothetical protein
MSFLLTRNEQLQSAEAVPVSEDDSQKLPGQSRVTLGIKRIAGVFFWYRRAVMTPESPKEQAEWQQTSF